MKLALIAAIAKHRVIGRDGKLPWHISDDLKRFKRLTTGHTVVMGRRTYESLGKPLAGRRNVVLSSAPIPGVETYRSVPDVLKALAHEEKVFVIGGAQVYAALLTKADELYLTFVEKDVPGDAFFPEFEHYVESNFVEIEREDHHGFSFVTYQRRSRNHPDSLPLAK